MTTTSSGLSGGVLDAAVVSPAKKDEPTFIPAMDYSIIKLESTPPSLLVTYCQRGFKKRALPINFKFIIDKRDSCLMKFRTFFFFFFFLVFSISSLGRIINTYDVHYREENIYNHWWLG